MQMFHDFDVQHAHAFSTTFDANPQQDEPKKEAREDRPTPPGGPRKKGDDERKGRRTFGVQAGSTVASQATQTAVSLPIRVEAIWHCHCPEAGPVVDTEADAEMGESIAQELPTKKSRVDERESVKVEADVNITSVKGHDPRPTGTQTSNGPSIAAIDNIEQDHNDDDDKDNSPMLSMVDSDDLPPVPTESEDEIAYTPQGRHEISIIDRVLSDCENGMFDFGWLDRTVDADDTLFDFDRLEAATPPEADDPPLAKKARRRSEQISRDWESIVSDLIHEWEPHIQGRATDAADKMMVHLEDPCSAMSVEDEIMMENSGDKFVQEHLAPVCVTSVMTTGWFSIMTPVMQDLWHTAVDSHGTLAKPDDMTIDAIGDE